MFTINEKDQNTTLLMVIGLKTLWIEEVKEEDTRGRKQSDLEHKDPGRKAKGRNGAENGSRYMCVCVCVSMHTRVHTHTYVTGTLLSTLPIKVFTVHNPMR